MPNPIRVYLPFNENVIISVAVAAQFLQRITLTFPDGSTRVFQGSGDRVLETFVFRTTTARDPLGFPVDVKIEYSSDGGRTFQLSDVRSARANAAPVFSRVVTSDDGGGDDDFNDAVVIFTWIRGT